MNENKKPQTNEDFKNEVKREIESNTNELIPNCLNIKSIKEWIEEAKNRPIPRMLFSELWYENELCILFSDSNLGKSILAIQIGNSISKGVSITGFKLETEEQKVLYFDFELTDKQLEKRYSNNYENHYIFNDNLLRAEINSGQETPEKFKSFEDFLTYSIECKIMNTDIKILIIDNVTYLRNETEKSKDALTLMKILNDFKKKYALSILVLAHTPKRDKSKPISKNDLSGSRMLMNFCDSAFAIGEDATEVSQRYIKQIKQRSTEQIYSENNVIFCKIEKSENFLKFVFIGYGNEFEHLTPKNPSEIIERNQKIIELHKQGISNSEIARQLNISEGTVRYVLNKQ